MRTSLCVMGLFFCGWAFASPPQILLVDETIEAGVAALEQFSGRKILRSSALPIVRINFDSTGLSEAEAVAALEGLLWVNGVAIVEQGERFSRAVPAALASSEIPHVYLESVSDLAPSGRIVSRLWHLNNTDAETVKNALAALVKVESGCSLSAVKGGNALLLVAPLSAVQQAEKIIAAVDVDRRSHLLSVRVPLAFADVSEVAKLFPATTTATSGGVGASTGVLENGTAGFSLSFRVQADTRSNSLVVHGTAEDVQRVKQLAAQVDLPLQQVRIEALILEVTLSDHEASGLASLGFGYDAGLSFSVNSSSTSGLETPFSVSGKFTGGKLSFSALLKQAQRSTRARVLSAPLVATSHGKAASFFVGQTRPLISSSQSSSEGTSTRSTVTQQEIGLKLSVTPRVGADGSVEMAISQTSETVPGSVSIDGNEQPIIARREASSSMTAASGEIVVLAGMQSRHETDSSGGVWLLRDLPLIGHWFRPSSRETERTELIVFLRPTVGNAGKVPAGFDLTEAEQAILERMRGEQN